MREKSWKEVITFHTTTEAMAVESSCRAGGMPGRLIPVPRQITAGCGMAWVCPLDEAGRLRRFMEGQGLSWDQAYEMYL